MYLFPSLGESIYCAGCIRKKLPSSLDNLSLYNNTYVCTLD
jgi:hypothetical protein